MKGQGTGGKGQGGNGNAKGGEFFWRKAVIGLDPAVAIVFIVVGLPVAGGLALAAFSEYLKHRRQIATLQGASDKREIEQLRERVRELEQRVETLEAIVTSPEFQIFRERMRQIRLEAEKALPSTQQPSTLPFPQDAEKQTQRS
jgi:cell division protein FtsB